MTLQELLTGLYAWALDRREAILGGSALLPVVGTALARIGKAGRTDADGRFVASAFMGIALAVFVVEVMALFVAGGALGRSVLQADVMLLSAPLICVGGCFFGIRMVFPLMQLGSVRTFIDVAAFVLACAGVVWLFSKFRGWGIFFFGSIAEMVAIGGLGLALLKRLYGRAVGTSSARAAPARSEETPAR